MANIIVLDEGTKKERYKVMYDVPTLPGQKRKRESKTFPAGTSKREVMQFKKKVEAELLTQSPMDSHDYTFAEVADRYLQNYTLNLAPNTLRGYKSSYERENGLKNHFGHIKVKRITTDQIQSYVTYLHNSGKSAKTISNIIGFLNVVMKHCTRLRYIPYNPVEGVILPKKKPKQPVQAYTAEQVQMLLQISECNRAVHTTIALGALAGLRRGEMAALTWDDVNLDDAVPSIHINKTKYHVSPNLGIANPIGVKEPKTNASIRTIPIPNRLADILRKERMRYKECKLRYGAEFLDSNCVIFQENGSDYQVDSINNGYTEFMQRYPEIPYYSLHKLRHTFASILASVNTPVKDVQELLGHSDISTTLQVYTHGYDETKRTAIAELDRLLSCS